MRVPQSEVDSNLNAIKYEVENVRGGKLLYVTISGSDLYGFPSEDSDVDWRGVFSVEPNELYGLYYNDEFRDNLRDIVMTDLKKEAEQLLKGNCNAMERLFANPVYTTRYHKQLREITLKTYSHNGVIDSYRGLATANHKKYLRSKLKSTSKKWLYVFRGLGCATHFVETGEIVPDILLRSKDEKIIKLLDIKTHGKEDEAITDRWHNQLEELYQLQLADLNNITGYSVMEGDTRWERTILMHKWLVSARKLIQAELNLGQTSTTG